MKSRKRTLKIPVKEIIFDCFMEDPLPMVITRAKDGAYVAVNKAAVRLMGLPRQKIIGRTSIQLGFFSAEPRKKMIDEIKKQGFANNISGKITIKNQAVLDMLFRVYPVKTDGETFLMITATEICNQKSSMGNISNDKFFKITRKDDKFIQERLKQYPLTPRQQEIALLCATGHSNGEIAEKLFISLYTVKDHQKEIFRITNIHNRMELFPKLLGLR